MSAKVLTKAGAREAKIELIEDGRGTQAVHETVVAMRAARRSGSANTKTKAEVNLSGAKPWRQKGTGRARAGYKSSPIWRGGGVVFGPKPRDYSKKISKSVRRLAFQKALSERINAGDVLTIDKFVVPELKTKSFLALLKKQTEAAVINVSSIVAFAPGLTLPTYSASKAALHSYTQALRLSLAPDTNVKVFELMPPLVDTEFAKDIPSDKKISPREVAEDLVQSLETNNYEVRVASTEQLYTNFLAQADKAVLALNRLEQN